MCKVADFKKSYASDSRLLAASSHKASNITADQTASTAAALMAQASASGEPNLTFDESGAPHASHVVAQ